MLLGFESDFENAWNVFDDSRSVVSHGLSHLFLLASTGLDSSACIGYIPAIDGCAVAIFVPASIGATT